MTNDELKKKIVDTMHPILKGTRVSCNEENACEHCLFPCEVDRIADRLADVLIAAGIGDVKEAAKDAAERIKNALFCEFGDDMTFKMVSKIEKVIKEVCNAGETESD